MIAEALLPDAVSWRLIHDVHENSSFCIDKCSDACPADF